MSDPRTRDQPAGLARRRATPSGSGRLRLTQRAVHDLDELVARRTRGVRRTPAAAVHLARDRFGIKPLYYRDEAGELAFASELRALPRGEVDPDALEAFLAFNSVPAPYSIFSGTRKLPAGHLLVWQDGGTRVDLTADDVPAGISADDHAEGMESSLRNLARYLEA